MVYFELKLIHETVAGEDLLAGLPIARADLRTARAATTGRLWAGLGLYNKSLDEALESTAIPSRGRRALAASCAL